MVKSFLHGSHGDEPNVLALIGEFCGYNGPDLLETQTKLFFTVRKTGHLGKVWMVGWRVVGGRKVRVERKPFKKGSWYRKAEPLSIGLCRAIEYFYNYELKDSEDNWVPDDKYSKVLVVLEEYRGKAVADWKLCFW